jgi:regulatory protein
MAARRPPPAPTEAWVLALARRYLELRSASEAAFRRWLGRRVGEAVRHHGTDPTEAARWIDAVVVRFQGLGLLDDARWAASRAAALRSRGRSGRHVRAALAAKGIAAPLIESVVPEGVDADLAAARKYARQHHLGPWRREGAAVDADALRRELARLARRGFGYDVARRALTEEP